MNGRDIRIGDLERDQAISQLHEQFALGRLGQDELEQRLESAVTAKTVGDLRAVVLDLPTTSEAVAWRHGRQPTTGRSGTRGHLQGEPESPSRTHRARATGLLPFVPFLMFMAAIGVASPVFLLLPMMMLFWVMVAGAAMRSHW